jgi:hypothetical protein
MKPRFFITLAACAAALGSIFSCATPAYFKTYQGAPLAREQIAVLAVNSRDAIVRLVDGKMRPESDELHARGNPGRYDYFDFQPGPHVIQVYYYYITGYSVSRSQGTVDINFDASAGHTYLIVNEVPAGQRWQWNPSVKDITDELAGAYKDLAAKLESAYEKYRRGPRPLLSIGATAVLVRNDDLIVSGIDEEAFRTDLFSSDSVYPYYKLPAGHHTVMLQWRLAGKTIVGLDGAERRVPFTSYPLAADLAAGHVYAIVYQTDPTWTAPAGLSLVDVTDEMDNLMETIVDALNKNEFGEVKVVSPEQRGD